MTRTTHRPAWRRVLIGAVLTSLVLVACSNTGEEIAGKIQKKLESNGIPVKTVSCDKKSAKKGDVFSCTATTTDGTTIPYKVTMTASDRFSADPTLLVVLKAGLEKALATSGRRITGEQAVTVSCGTKAVYTGPQIKDARCVGTVDGVSVPLLVTLDGTQVVGAPAKPLVIKAKVESELADQLKTAAGDGTTFTIDCGTAKVTVLASADSTFECTGAASDGSKGKVTAKIQQDGTAKATSVTQTS
jgi:hypothetical protein